MNNRKTKNEKTSKMNRIEKNGNKKKQDEKMNDKIV